MAPMASVTPGEGVPVVTTADRVAAPPRPVLPLLVQVVERVVANLAAVAEGGDTSHVEERAVIVDRKGSVEVSHDLDGSSASGRSASF